MNIEKLLQDKQELHEKQAAIDAELDKVRALLCDESKPTATAPTDGGYNVGDHILVCTEKRGVFAGRVESFDTERNEAVLTGVRMCIMFWDGRGVLGLTDKGPTNDRTKHIVSGTSPRGRVVGITYDALLSETASKAWDSVPANGD